MYPCDTNNGGTNNAGIQNAAPRAASGVYMMPRATALNRSASPHTLKIQTVFHGDQAWGSLRRGTRLPDCRFSGKNCEFAADRLQGDRWLAMAGNRGRCDVPHPCIMRSIGSDCRSRLQIGESVLHLQSGDFRYARRNDLHFLDEFLLVDLPCRKSCRANAKIHAALG